MLSSRLNAFDRDRVQPVQPVAIEEQCGRHRDLDDELRRRLERDEVVDEADDEHEGGAAEHHGHLAVQAERDRGAKERESDSDAPEQRNGAAMPPVRARVRHAPEPVRRKAARRHEQQRQRQRDGELRSEGKHRRFHA